MNKYIIDENQLAQLYQSLIDIRKSKEWLAQVPHYRIIKKVLRNVALTPFPVDSGARSSKPSQEGSIPSEGTKQ